MAILEDSEIATKAEERTRFRLKSAGTKLNQQELRDLSALAKRRGVRPGELIRKLILDELARDAGVVAASTELTEIMGIRLMLTNLFRPVATGQKLTPEDPTLNPTVGACVTCPRRSGYNTSLFCDVQGDQCLDAPCYQIEVTAHIDRELAARPHLVSIETAWRSPKEQHPGALQKHQYRELDTPDNMDAEPPCDHTKAAIVVFGKGAGRSITVCTETNCPVHNPHVVARRAEEQAAHPEPVMAPAPQGETEEQAAERQAEYERQRKVHEAEQQRREEEPKRQFNRDKEGSDH